MCFFLLSFIYVPEELHSECHHSESTLTVKAFNSIQVTWGSDGHSIYAGELLRGAHLDDDVPATFQAQVARRAGRRHVEGDPVVLGGDGELVGAHFVGRVAVGHHPVGAHHHGCESQEEGEESERIIHKHTHTHTSDVRIDAKTSTP